MAQLRYLFTKKIKSNIRDFVDTSKTNGSNVLKINTPTKGIEQNKISIPPTI